MSKTKINTKLIAGTGILLAIVLVLQPIANIVQIGAVSLNFSILPIALASIMLP